MARESLLEILQCPYCGGDLEVEGHSARGPDVEFGTLRCQCYRYGIVLGVVVLRQASPPNDNTDPIVAALDRGDHDGAVDILLANDTASQRKGQGDDLPHGRTAEGSASTQRPEFLPGLGDAAGCAEALASRLLWRVPRIPIRQSQPARGDAGDCRHDEGAGQGRRHDEPALGDRYRVRHRPHQLSAQVAGSLDAGCGGRRRLPEPRPCETLRRPGWELRLLRCRGWASLQGRGVRRGVLTRLRPLHPRQAEAGGGAAPNGAPGRALCPLPPPQRGASQPEPGNTALRRWVLEGLWKSWGEALCGADASGELLRERFPRTGPGGRQGKHRCGRRLHLSIPRGG